MPSRASITPLFSIWGATKPTRPASLAVIVPELMILASGYPGFVNLAFAPFIKAASFSISVVVATNDPTSTRDVEPKTIPLGLIITNLPFADISPSMRDALVSVIRLIVMEFELGCWNLTFSDCPTSKLFHRIMARSVLWVIIVS